MFTVCSDVLGKSSKFQPHRNLNVVTKFVNRCRAAKLENMDMAGGELHKQNCEVRKNNHILNTYTFSSNGTAYFENKEARIDVIDRMISHA